MYTVARSSQGFLLEPPRVSTEHVVIIMYAVYHTATVVTRFISRVGVIILRCVILVVCEYLYVTVL